MEGSISEIGWKIEGPLSRLGYTGRLKKKPTVGQLPEDGQPARSIHLDRREAVPAWRVRGSKIPGRTMVY